MGQVSSTAALVLSLSLLLASSASAEESAPIPDPDSQPGSAKKEEIAEPEPTEEEVTEAEARRAFRLGDSKYLEGDYQGAAEAFQEAYALSGKIEMLFNLANAYERMGKYLEASFALQSYIPHAPPAARPKLERRMKRLQQMAEAEEKQAILAAVPLSSAPGDSHHIPFDRVAGIGMLTLGISGIIAGTAFGISALRTRAHLNELCEDDRHLCPEEAEPLVERDRAHSLIADIALIGGNALTAVGVYLVVRRHESKEIRVTASGLGAAVGGSF